MDAAQTQQFPNLRGKRVVVCEDEAITQMQLARVLARAGLVKVGEARSGEEAVALALQERPDIVLMDVGLEGMDGWQASQAILAVYSPCILVLTGQRAKNYAEFATKIAVRGYIGKPVLGSDVIATIADACAPADTGLADTCAAA